MQDQYSSDYIARSRACSNCRRRKVKCDGAKPVCGPCSRARVEQDCQYVGIRGVSQNELLEEQISILQQRLNQLENPKTSDGSGPVYLYHPYISTTPTVPQDTTGRLDAATSRASSPTHLPPSEKEEMIRGVLSNSVQFSFCLDHGTFIQGALASATTQRTQSLRWKYLISVILACGTLAIPQKYGKHQQAFLKHALANRAAPLQETQDVEGIILLQAEVLLTRYFMYLGKYLEASYHCCVALSCLISLRFHRIRPASQQQGIIEEMERIRICWAVYENDCLLAVLQNTTKNCIDYAHLGSLDIPFLGLVNDHTRLPLFPSVTNPLRQWRAEIQRDGSLDTLQLNASMLLYTVHALALKYVNRLNQHTPPPPDEFAELATASKGLLNRIRAGRNNLQTNETLYHYLTAESKTLMAQIMLNTTYIGMYPDCRTRRRDLAVAIIQLIPRFAACSMYKVVLHPCMGNIWLRALQIIREEQSIPVSVKYDIQKAMEVLEALQRTSPPEIRNQIETLKLVFR